MLQKEDESLLKILEKKVYNKLKKKLLPKVVHCEYQMLTNFLKDIKAIKTFYLRELHGIARIFTKNKNSDNNNDLEYYLLFPKNKGEALQINDYMTTSMDSKNIYINNYVYKINFIYEDEWESHKKLIIRLPIQNKDKQIENHISKNSANELKKDNNIIINDNSNLNISNFIDIVLSIYVDVNNNATILINEFFYDLNEIDFLRFYERINILYEKLNNFIDKNFNIYLCNESILINRSISQLFNYLMSLKIFYTKRIIVKDIQKFKDEINIYVDIKDRIYPNSVYKTRCHILKLSNISCFVSIVSLIDVKHFSLNKRFLMLKASIILVLKILKRNIEREIIES